MPFRIVQGDITRVRADAVVNAANNYLAAGGGVCGAIFAAAGREKLQRACSEIGFCHTGEAVATPAFDLPAKYIIHTVGPVWSGGYRDEERLLRSCYRSVLKLAEEKGCGSVAFPLISSGIYGCPFDTAFRIASGTIREYLRDSELDVTLVLYDRSGPLAGLDRFEKIRRYLEERYEEELTAFSEDLSAGCDNAPSAPLPCASTPAARAPAASRAAAPSPAPDRHFSLKRSLADAVARLSESFSARLFRLIDERGLSDSEVYKRANIDRRLFSKIRKEGYNPSKSTVLALAIALKLNSDETRDLLKRAGFALSDSSRADVIVSWFIEEGIYDIYAVNEALFDFGEHPLGN